MKNILLMSGSSSIINTNDMLITYPSSFKALNLFPHQITPPFIPGKMQGHNGESREERLAKFLIVNPTALVHTLPEGTALYIQGNQARLSDEQAVPTFSENTRLNILAAGSTFNY